MALWLAPVSILLDLIGISIILAALMINRRIHEGDNLRTRPVWAYRRLASTQLAFMTGHVFIGIGSVLMLADPQPYVILKVLDGFWACAMVVAFFITSSVRQTFKKRAELAEKAIMTIADIPRQVEEWLRHQ